MASRGRAPPRFQCATEFVLSVTDLICILHVMARSALMVIVLLGFPLFYVGSAPQSDYTAIAPLDPNSLVLETENIQQQLKLWVEYNVIDAPAVFESVASEGLLREDSKALCNGIIDWPDVFLEGTNLIPQEKSSKLPFPDVSFGFVLWIVYDPNDNEIPASEIDRVLETDGLLVLHLNGNSSLHSTIPRIMSISSFMIVHVRKFDNNGLDHLIAFRKVHPLLTKDVIKPKRSPVSSEKMAAMSKLENLLLEQQPTEDSSHYWQKFQYLPNIMGYPETASSYVYIDIGSNIGPWFILHYPKHGHQFKIYASDTDRHGYLQRTYRDHHHFDIELLPYYSWIKNGMPKSKQVYDLRALARQLSEWLEKTVDTDDYVVMKMDVGGAEYELLPWLVQTGSICLIDELFLECHDDHSVRNMKHKHNRAYWKCIHLYEMLRDVGVASHQWWA